MFPGSPKLLLKNVTHIGNVLLYAQPQDNCPGHSKIVHQNNSTSLGRPPLHSPLIPPRTQWTFPSRQPARPRRRPRVRCPSRPSPSKHISPKKRSSYSVPPPRPHMLRSGKGSSTSSPTKRASHYDMTSPWLTLSLITRADPPRALCTLGLRGNAQGAQEVPRATSLR